MIEQLKNIGKNITEFWSKLSKKNRNLIIGGVTGLIVMALILAFILNNKEYVVLFKNIDQEESVEVLQQLQENKIDYKYNNDGSILIPEEQESILRMQLAQSGHPRTGSNYDVFTQNIDFMTTDYEKRQYEVFQLQERLQDSIKTINGVKEVIVTINLPEDKSFAWETDRSESSASVKLNLVNGKSLTNSQTDGIIQLVCKSVEGLKEENVAIIDTDGNSLKVNDEVLQTNKIKLKLEIEKEFEKEIEKSAFELLSTMYGPENVQVSAKCTINFDKKISEILQYLPDEETKLGVPSDTQNEREIAGPGEVVEGIPGAETNAEVPTYPGVTIEGDDIYFKDSNTINYLVSQLKEQIEYNPGNIDELTVAVAINKASMSDDETDEVRQLVAFSSGVEAEKIALHNMKFYDPDSPTVPVAVTDPSEANMMSKILIYGGIALALVAILIFIISVIIRKKRKKKANENVVANQTENFSWDEIQDEIKLQETQEQVMVKQIKEFTNTNPEIASQLIRTWLKGEDD
ncbi:flagellar basal-body MS-ring/collar protein FliF [Sedimentibacter sp. MB31-C6]|uniref:flagellar basal-body MS-ring/collar protein FliF n=1 Tax=Sedimentibacter sp. MB31-C6 TaxID=3109366 RepID=UPI002DDCC41B|nr:flagellar basal-body MS-ring/collar protein FliF [Sedimentibacter sp. MB36-C1]WSI04996.1 flagellar basal-body MS-ring/collar protein FliF [Sedimentibacter sp. MB36-C1]